MTDKPTHHQRVVSALQRLAEQVNVATIGRAEHAAKLAREAKEREQPPAPGAGAES